MTIKQDGEEGSLVLLKQGAEARVFESTFMGRKSVVKERFSKKYRHPSLDAKLTLKRLNAEARCMTKARGLGVYTPVLYAVDTALHTLTFEYVEGQMVKEVLLHFGSHGIIEEKMANFAKQIGIATAKIHDGGLIHGDLTTSNMIIRKDTNQLVRSLRRMDQILTSYRRSTKQWSSTFNKLAQVGLRGRKLVMIG